MLQYGRIVAYTTVPRFIMNFDIVPRVSRAYDVADDWASIKFSSVIIVVPSDYLENTLINSFS